jgi:hypothetical protein
MVKRGKLFRLGFWVLCIALLCCLAYSIAAFAGERDYPLQGSVVALGTTQEMIGGGGPGPVSTMLHRTYTVKSSTKVYVLECPNWMNGFHIHSPSECGGSKKIEIGDVIHFRVAKTYAYIPADKGKEEKLHILSEAELEVPRS